MPPVGIEPTIPVFERTKTVYAVDHAATVMSDYIYGILRFIYLH
jgi:hypothetical protein